MSKGKIDKEKVIRKFTTLSASSDCIQKTSKYLYQYYKSSDIIVNIWLETLNSATSDEARISLFYIANEMLQTRTYGNSYFKKSWKPHLGHSIDCIKHSSVNDKILRILNIWIERKVYDQSFVDTLISRLCMFYLWRKIIYQDCLATVKYDDTCKDVIRDFDPEEAMETLKQLIAVEHRTIKAVKHHEYSINFDETLSNEAILKLKDKNDCNDFRAQLDNNINHLAQVCTLLGEELKIRQKTFEAMKNADIFYETQQTETLVVEDAYRRYGYLISKTKEVLAEHVEFLVDDNEPIEVDDVLSPGKTPPHLYFKDTQSITTTKADSPMSYDAELSPVQSFDVSEDDSSSLDNSNYSTTKPFSPSHQIAGAISLSDAPTKPLSSTDALKLLSSVFSQSLTKKPFSDVDTNANQIVDKLTKNDNKNVDKIEKSDTVFNETFRLISNLTGLKNVRERTLSSESSSNVGATIPILTSKIPFKTSEECNVSKPISFSFNQPNFAATNIFNSPNTISQLRFPISQMTTFAPPTFTQPPPIGNALFPLVSDTSVPPPPLFNPMAFTLPPMNKNNQSRMPQSPGSCTEDEEEGGATPTQDEPAALSSTLAVKMFNQNVLPVLASGAHEINKQINNVLNTASATFGLQNMLPISKDLVRNTQLQQQPPPPPWTNMAGPMSFNMSNTNLASNMSIPFPLMSPSNQIRTPFNPTNNNSSNKMATYGFGVPRAIRTSRPNDESGPSSFGRNEEDSSSASGSQSPVPRQQPHHDSDLSDVEMEDLESMRGRSDHSHSNDNEVLNLYGDVDDKIDVYLSNDRSQTVSQNKTTKDPRSKNSSNSF